MSLRVVRPSHLLAPYVMTVWDYENLTGDANSVLTILPDTATYVCFLYGDLLRTTHKNAVYTTRSGLAGFQSYRSDLGGTGSISGVSARLTPWGLNVFRKGLAPDCAERRVDCRDIFPRHAVEQIEDQLGRLKSAAQRVRCVEEFLLGLLNQHNEDLLVAGACRDLNATNGNCSIRMLAHSLGTTERTLERRFVSQVGTTVKKYARIVRLRNAVLMCRTLPSWADVAYAAGYYDQSHMIRDFQEMYGLSPETLYPRVETSRTIQRSGLVNLHPAA